MRRTVRPGLEVLEGKALLSGIAMAATSGLASSLTAVAGRTPSGVRVVETFTETNTSDHDITVVHGPSDDGFTVTRAGKTVWSPEQGIVAQYLALDDLKPHQSLTVTNAWDGRSDLADPDDPGVEGPTLAGTFTISDRLDQGKATASVTIPRAWTTPAAKPTHILPIDPPAQDRG